MGTADFVLSDNSSRCLALVRDNGSQAGFLSLTCRSHGYLVFASLACVFGPFVKM